MFTECVTGAYMLCPPELLKAQGGGFGKNGIIKIYQKGIFCKLQHDSNVRLLTGSLTLTDFAEVFVVGSAQHTYFLTAWLWEVHRWQEGPPALDLGFTGPC